jgi:hypothetical protein
VTSLNGTLKGGHLVTASLTIASKRNINDDFSPALTDYPNDPAKHRGRIRTVARRRARAVRHVGRPPPARQFHVAPIFEYGSGQPWNSRLGYDFNGDGKVADRAAGLRSSHRTVRVSPASTCALATVCRSAKDAAPI